MQRHRAAFDQAWRLIRAPGGGTFESCSAIFGSEAGSIWLRDCTLAASDDWRSRPVRHCQRAARPSAASCRRRNPASRRCRCRWDRVLRKWRPRPASGTGRADFWSGRPGRTGLWVMLPEPEVSIESNSSDIFCCGGLELLAPETACMPEAAPTPVMSIAKPHHADRLRRASQAATTCAGRSKEFVYHNPTGPPCRHGSRPIRRCRA